jgi:hypothetical protein
MTNPYYEITIFKPLYETDDGYTVGIYDKRINDAIRNKQLILIKTKKVAKIFFPKWIKKNCKTIEKIYLRPNEPMREYLVFIPKPKKKSEDEELKELATMGVFG